MRMVSNIVRSSFLTFIFVATSYFAQASEARFNVKIAICDAQAIQEQSIAIHEIRKAYDVISEEIQKDLSIKDAELKKNDEEITRKKGIISDEILEKEIALFHKKVNEAKKDFQLKKSKLEQAHSEAVEKVHDATIEIIKKLSKKYSLKLVIPSSQVLFASPELDITNIVIELLNTNLKMVKINY